MARNASGTYSLPAGNPVVSGTTVASSWANTTLNDLATEVTDSLSRSGKGGMLAQLGLIDGTVAAPALAFSSELGSGLYRAAANDLRVAVAGADRVRVTATALSLKGAGLITAADTTNLGLTLKGNLNAADTGADFILDTSVTRTAGALFALRNNNSNRILVNPDGSVNLPNAASILATGTDVGLNLQGNRNAGSATADVTVQATANRTAGYVFDTVNNGASKFAVGWDGKLYKNGVEFTGSRWGIAEVASDYTNATTGATDITGASFAAAATTKYRIRGLMWTEATATNIDPRWRMKGTGAPTVTTLRLFWIASQNANLGAGIATAVDTDASGTLTFGGANSPVPVQFEGILVTGASSGTFQLQERNVNAGTTTIRAGSWLEYMTYT